MTIRSYPQGTPIGTMNAITGTPALVNLTTAAGGAGQNGYLVTTDLQIVTVADGTNKVLTLPDPNKYVGSLGDDFIVVNSASGQTLSVFPPTGGNINAAGANTAVTIAQNKSAVFYLVSYTATTSVWTGLVGA